MANLDNQVEQDRMARLKSDIRFAQYHLDYYPNSHSDQYWHTIIQRSKNRIKKLHSSDSIPFLHSPSSITILPKQIQPPPQYSSSLFSCLPYSTLRITPPTFPTLSSLTLPPLHPPHSALSRPLLGPVLATMSASVSPASAQVAPSALVLQPVPDLEPEPEPDSEPEPEPVAKNKTRIRTRIRTRTTFGPNPFLPSSS